jgi:hypothetical protein
MIKIKITESQIKRAKKLFSFNKLKNSIKEGEGNLLGAIGEIVAFDYYQEQGKLVIHSGDFNFDLLIDGSKQWKSMQRQKNITNAMFHYTTPNNNVIIIYF